LGLRNDETSVLHRTRHGIGVTTHEPPSMVEGETQPLQPGCASRSSPASTSPAGSAFGEGIVTITDDGGRRLNGTTHEMQIVAT